MLDKLKKNISDLEIMTELSKKGYDMNAISNELLRKKIEDGLIVNFNNASTSQLNTLKNSKYFRYYDQKEVNLIIDAELKRKLREQKIKRIIE